MKRELRILFWTLFIFTIPLTLRAQGPPDSPSGFSGRLQAGGLFMQTTNQLSTESGNQRTEDLDGPANTRDILTGMAFLYLQYQFESGTTLYVGNPFEAGEGLTLQAGMSQPIGASTLDVNAIWLPIENVWEDPYQVGRDRDETRVDAYGVQIEWQRIGGSPWELSYSLNRFDVEDDLIGDLEADLKRDGWTHEGGVKFNLALGPKLLLQPRVTYSYADKEGDSNSYHGIESGVLMRHTRPPWVLIGWVSGAYRSYQETHPLFDETRKEGEITTFAQLMRLNLFGFQRLFASVAGAYVWMDANIDFFDSQTLFGLATVGINF
jgi:hypothetical protein